MPKHFTQYNFYVFQFWIALLDYLLIIQNKNHINSSILPVSNDINTVLHISQSINKIPKPQHKKSISESGSCRDAKGT